MLNLYRAHSALQHGEWVRARQLFTLAGRQGDPRGWFLLGVMVSQGEGGLEEPERAAALYQRAAEGGCADGAYNLAVLYAQGRGVPQDYHQARRWYREAAEAADVQAQHMLGVMYARGEGGGVDFLEAARWWGVASSHGHAESMLFLAHMYLHGDGVAVDLMQAARWYLRSALAGEEQALTSLTGMREVLQERAHQDDPDALYVLARMLDAGLEGPPDLVGAERLYQRAAHLEHPVSCRCLGTLYRRMHAEHWEQVGAMVARLYRTAGEKGDAEACHNLAYMYSEGLAMEPDPEAARHWFLKAARMGLVYAQVDLAWLLSEQPGAQAEALRWLSAAARGGLGEAMLQLGAVLWEGRWGRQDREQGLRWMLHAVQVEAEGALEEIQRRVGAAPHQLMERAALQVPGDGSRIAELVLSLTQIEG